MVLLCYLLIIYSNSQVFTLIILRKLKEIYPIDLEQKARARLGPQENKPLLISVCSTLHVTIY